MHLEGKNEEVGLLTGEQIRAARALLRIEQRELAEAAGVSLETIKRLEKQRGTVAANLSTVQAIRDAIRAAGVDLIEKNGGGPGVRLRE